jgi:hypothetical protein
MMATSPSNDKKITLSRWRERVRVRVERVDFPLTLILSPKGERRYDPNRF